MAEFIKIGNEITVKPKLEGISYELTNNKVYDLEYDRMQGRSYLKENGDLNMPKKLYELEEDNKFIKRVLDYLILKILERQQVYCLLVLKVQAKQCSLNVLP